MTNKGIIAAALILGLSIILAVWLPIHYQEVRRLDQKQVAACEKAKAARDNCNTFFTTPISQQRCHAAWDPEVGDRCYGIKPSPVADKELFQ